MPLDSYIRTLMCRLTGKGLPQLGKCVTKQREPQIHTYTNRDVFGWALSFCTCLMIIIAYWLGKS